MSYRKTHDHPEICGVPTHAKIHLLNGSSLEFEITCSYAIPPVAPATEETYDPIHLIEEGYGEPMVAFADAPIGLTGEAWIDPADDSIVHCVYTAYCDDAISVDIECSTSVLITRDTGVHGLRTDCVLRGTVEIEAGPLPGGVIQT